MQQYCIVTGANAGLGKEITAGLMAKGDHVVMACRDMDACHAAQLELQRKKLPGSCECCRLDLADLRSISSFAQQQLQQLQQRKQPLRVLVNNAGVMGVAPGPSGEDKHLAVNHLGPFLLTLKLLPSMASGSRIINVASRAHFWGSIKVSGSKLQPGSQHWFGQYAASKLCNILVVAELQRRFQLSRGIIATAASPGFVNTTIFRSVPSSVAWLLKGMAAVVGKTPAEGARVVLYAATSPDLTSAAPVPLLLHNCKPMQPSRLAEDKQLAADVWAASTAAVGWTDTHD